LGNLNRVKEDKDKRGATKRIRLSILGPNSCFGELEVVEGLNGRRTMA